LIQVRAALIESMVAEICPR